MDLPNFVGMTVEEVKAEIEKNADYQGFQIDYQYKTDSTKEVGVVLSQNPDGKIKVKHDATSCLVVNQGGP